ncbi:hypothetical protein GE09DRAFT_1260913 [Coniochaeta sp. 2T2.1]|nr:hypothetical protein GE09DRAFT_1260913 [Coniochaeta sp. 2T2.1]
MAGWKDMPGELRLQVYRFLSDMCSGRQYAHVSREWRAEFEQRNFRHLRLTQSHLYDFETIVTPRHKMFIRHIELDIIIPGPPGWGVPNTITQVADESSGIVRGAIRQLFHVLQDWPNDIKLPYAHLPITVSVSVFEGDDEPGPVWKVPMPDVVDAFVGKCSGAEHVTATSISMADAREFFSGLRAWDGKWTWHWLRTLALVSRELYFTEHQRDPTQIIHLLENAGRAALHIPRLEILGIRNEMASTRTMFIYRRGSKGEERSITWRGTWYLPYSPDMIRIWGSVGRKHRGCPPLVDLGPGSASDLRAYIPGEEIFRRDFARARPTPP